MKPNIWFVTEWNEGETTMTFRHYKGPVQRVTVFDKEERMMVIYVQTADLGLAMQEAGEYGRVSSVDTQPCGFAVIVPEDAKRKVA